MAAQVHLRREVHSPGDVFPGLLQAVDGLAVQSSQNGTEGGEVVESSTFLEMRTL
jgi:hypothetical protein